MSVYWFIEYNSNEALQHLSQEEAYLAFALSQTSINTCDVHHLFQLNTIMQN